MYIAGLLIISGVIKKGGVIFFSKAEITRANKFFTASGKASAFHKQKT